MQQNNFSNTNTLTPQTNLHLQCKQALMDFFKNHARTMPWRTDPTPYNVWISEVMLQQTQVQTVIPYFNRWMAKFPDINTLASANIDEINELWAGLGYYRRAANILKTAIILRDNHNAQLPSDLKALLKLPGIGDYTANAIASFAFLHDTPAIDGNLERVFARLLAIKDDVRSSSSKKTIRNFATSLSELGSSNITNQALMDIGATICTRKPSCDRCPLKHLCQAYAHQLTSEIPLIINKTTRYYEQRLAILATYNEQLLLIKNEHSNLLRGLWELPAFTLKKQKISSNESKPLKRPLTISPDLQRLASLKLIETLQNPNYSDFILLDSTIEHQFTHIDMTMHLMTTTLNSPPIPNHSINITLATPTNTPPISTLIKKILKILPITKTNTSHQK